MDFTHAKYEELCKAMVDFIRHDIDRKPERALKMAEIEHDFGVKSTYYFRM